MDNEQLNLIINKLQQMGYSEQDLQELEEKYPEMTSEEVMMAAAMMGL